MKLNLNKKKKKPIGKCIIYLYDNNLYNVSYEGKEEDLENQLEIAGVFIQEIVRACINTKMPKKNMQKMFGEIYDKIKESENNG